MKFNKKAYIVSENIHNDKKEVDLDEAMDIIGLGWYNIKYCLLFALFLISAIIEPLGYSFILPSAKCDLDIDNSQRGLISSMPYIAIVVTSFPWGYLVDTRGRKPMIIFSAFGVAIFGVLAGFMPNLSSYVVFKLLASLCLACSAAAPYAFIGEILPQKHRDIAMSITNAMQALGSTSVPLLAWAILPLEFRIDFGLYYFRPWRLLTIVYSSVFFICGLLMLVGPESPKYLVAQGRPDEALKVLEDMYNGNHRHNYGKFPVASLRVNPKMEAETKERESKSIIESIVSQSLPLLKPPYLKWMALNSILLFGIFATLNGLFMWVPDVLNKVLSGSVERMTACEVITQSFNKTGPEILACNDSIEPTTFMINSIANFGSCIVTLLASGLLKIAGKKVLIVGMYLIMGTFCISINFARDQYVFAALLSTLQIPALGIGPINAYAVQMFPTELRGMAVGLGLMFGRMGSVIGTNVAGILISSECEAAFYLFGGLLLFCGLLSLILPRS